MAQIRTAALSRHAAPDFVLIAGLELMQLRKVSWLARALFSELVAMADHVSGRISTSYAVLTALLDFDAAPTANTPDRATVQRLRTALAGLIELRLVFVDTAWVIDSKKRDDRRLFFELPSRVGMSAAAQMRNRERNRPPRAKKPTPTIVCAVPTPDEQQDAQQGVQEREIPPNPPLSTGSSDPAEARAQMERTKRALKARRGVKNSPPRGEH